MSRPAMVPFFNIVVALCLSGAAMAQQGGGRGGDGSGGASGGSTPMDILAVHRLDQTQRDLAEVFHERMAGRACLTHVCSAPPPRNQRQRGQVQQIRLTASCSDDVVIRHREPGSGATVYACGRTALR